MIRHRMDSKIALGMIISIAISVIIFFSCSSLKPAAEFSADIEISMPDSLLKGKIYVDGYHYRIDIDDGLETISVIVNQKAGMTYILLQSEKVCSYMESDSPASIENDPFQAIRFHSDSGDKIFLSEDKVDSFLCEKSEIKNGDSVFTVWESSELGFPLQIEQSQGNVKTKLENISIKEIPESLFTIPEDYIIMMNRWRNR